MVYQIHLNLLISIEPINPIYFSYSICDSFYYPTIPTTHFLSTFNFRSSSNASIDYLPLVFTISMTQVSTYQYICQLLHYLSSLFFICSPSFSNICYPCL